MEESNMRRRISKLEPLIMYALLIFMMFGLLWISTEIPAGYALAGPEDCISPIFSWCWICVPYWVCLHQIGGVPCTKE